MRRLRRAAPAGRPVGGGPAADRAGGAGQRPQARRGRPRGGRPRLRHDGGAAGGARRRPRVRPGDGERLRAARHARARRPGRGHAPRREPPGRGHLDHAGGAGAPRPPPVDDHPVVREGLRGMLSGEEDLEVVAEAGGAAEAVAAVRAHEPDVVLMDLRMPGGDGVEATSRVLVQRPQARVVVLTTYETDADILRAVEAGAAGYLLKDASRAELAQAIRAAARGETVLAPSVAAKLVSRMRSPVELSRREIEVLRLVARGRTNAEIGRELLISEATVKTHLLRAIGKLDVSDRTAAVTAALERGILPAPGRKAVLYGKQ